MNNLFLHNKYSRIYDSLINRAQGRCLHGYSEKHHIIPRSLGGNNHSSNLVELTAREHFIAHLLLIKMTTGKHKASMVYAAKNMLHWYRKSRSFKISNRIYEILRTQHSQVVSKNMKAHYAPGTHAHHKISEFNRAKAKDINVRNKISDALKGKSKSDAHRLALSISAKKRKPMSDETRKKMSELLALRWQDPKYRARLKASHHGRTLSEKHKQKIALALRGKNKSPEARAKMSIKAKQRNFIRDEMGRFSIKN